MTLDDDDKPCYVYILVALLMFIGYFVNMVVPIVRSL